MATIHKMQVSKKVKGVDGIGTYVPVGTVDINLFGLNEFDASLPKPDSVNETGEPQYSNPAIQAVQDAITAALKADARNKLKAQSVDLKDGAKIASTVAEFLEVAERSGAAMQLVKQFADDFSAYLAAHSGKKQSIQELYVKIARVRSNIAMATQPYRDGMLAQLTNWAASMTPEQLTKYEGLLAIFEELCTKEVETFDENDA